MQGYTKINDSNYRVNIKGETVDLFVPFAKQELIFSAVVESGCIINDEMDLNPYMLVKQFSKVGAILLNQYDDEGNLIKAGNCNLMDTKDVLNLVKIALEVFRSFTQDLSALNQEEKTETAGKSKKEKTAKE